MRYTNPQTRNQLTQIGWCTLALLSIIFARLLFLQIFHHQILAQLGERNFTRIKLIEPLRGNILDCNGNLLATNRPVFNIDWIGTSLPSLTEDQKNVITTIEQTLNKYNHPIFIEISKIKKAEKYGTSVRLASDVNIQALSEISEQCADSPNIIISKKFQRFYPYKNLACHILGYLGDLDNNHLQSNGKMGLELIFNDILKGKHGTMSHIINSVGKNLHMQPIADCKNGQNLMITIDTKLQQIAENIMPCDHAGAFILLDPQTGALKTLVSNPGFDPSIFLKSISPDEWKILQHNRPFINRAFNALYPPASIFKLVTFSAALEQNIITPESKFYCKGYTIFKDRKYYCNKRAGHGLLDIKGNLAHSCNIGCYQIAQKISIDTLADYAYRFGLGTKTNEMFPENPGIVPSNEWKKMVKGEPWWKGETLSAAIGQSFLLVTPIQIACMIGGIFHGYLVKPRILEEDSIEKTPLDVKTSTREFLQDCMQSAIQIGTGRKVGRLKNIQIYAKTGTAQTKTRVGDIKELQTDCHAWCVIYFTYQNHDPLVMVILIEHAGGSAVATAVAEKFLNQYMKLYK
ncbi:MAG: penicillin-binding transpeptidase domain-containing protein [Candidatus Chromulinivorax sp.]